MLSNDYSMKFYIGFSFFILLLLNGNQLKAQDGNPDEQALAKGSEVLNKAAQSINQNQLKLNAISLVFSVVKQTKLTRNEKVSESTERGERELNIQLPNKIKYFESLGTVDYTGISEYTLNETDYSSENYSLSQGRRVSYEVKGGKLSPEEQKQQGTLWLKRQAFIYVFPITLEPFADSPAFKYVGKAEADDSRADVLEVTLSDENKARFFFDEQTHLLRMIIMSGKNRQSGEYEEKRFFSDYKKIDGLMVANKINVERKESVKIANQIANVEQIEEITLKSIKFNPTLKSDIFKVSK